MWVPIQHVLPQRLVSRATYHLARTSIPWIKGPLIRWFARQYGIRLEEAEQPDPASYATFNAFFTRALKPDARPVAGGEDTVVSPVDGILTEVGPLDGERILQAKGMGYSLPELVGGRVNAAPFLDGSSATLYLAPHHYHRVHMPLDGTLTRTCYIPGRRFSVNARTVGAIQGLFCRNERAVCWFETAHGPMAVVLVGALNVSSISTVWLGEIASGRRREWRPTPREFRRGEEIGRFNLGSTVILLFAPGAVAWREDVALGAELAMGQPLGTASRSVSRDAPADSQP